MLAETWHIPPWEIEEKAPDLWIQRWELLEVERQKMRDKPHDKGSLI